MRYFEDIYQPQGFIVRAGRKDVEGNLGNTSIFPNSIKHMQLKSHHL